MQMSSSAKWTWREWVSAVECTATVLMPSSLQERMTRRAISPRLAMRIFLNTEHPAPVGGTFHAADLHLEIVRITGIAQRGLVGDQLVAVKAQDGLIEGLRSVLGVSLADAGVYHMRILGLGQEVPDGGVVDHDLAGWRAAAAVLARQQAQGDDRDQGAGK